MKGLKSLPAALILLFLVVRVSAPSFNSILSVSMCSIDYEQSVFVPEILCAIGKVKIMQIRERNEKASCHSIVLLLLRIRVFASQAGKRKRLLAV